MQARASRVGSLPEAAGAGQGAMIPMPWSTLPQAPEQAPEQAACRIARQPGFPARQSRPAENVMGPPAFPADARTPTG